MGALPPGGKPKAKHVMTYDQVSAAITKTTAKDHAMNPTRQETINGYLIEEYVWGRELVCYVNNNRRYATFDDLVAWAKEQPVDVAS